MTNPAWCVNRACSFQKQTLTSIEAALGEQPLNDADIEAALQFRADIIDGMQAPTFEDKRRVLELLRVRVNLTEEKAVVTCVIPMEPCVIDSGISRNR